MEILFYPYDFSYKTENGKTFALLYGKTKDNKKICVVHEHPPFFYAKRSLKEEKEKLQNLVVTTKDKPAKIVKVEEAELELLGEIKRFWRLYTNYPKADSSNHLDLFLVFEVFDLDFFPNPS